MIEVKETTYGSWGNCIKITNGTVELFATVDFGPRIIRYGKAGGVNVMFEDINDEINKNECPDIFAEAFGAEKGVWHIRGGHRLWVGPEYLPRTYYPDNEPVEYKITKNGVILTPPLQVWNNLQYVIEIAMEEDGTVKLCHQITNKAPFASEFAPWALSVLAKDGFEVFPQPTKDTGFLSNRQMALWPYTRLTDDRVYWGDKYITLKQDKNAEVPFKVGINCDFGWAAYFLGGDMFVKRFDYNENATYPDGGMNFETYTSHAFLEMESLGELKSVQPGETVCHNETWQYFIDVPCPGSDEEKIDEIAKKYIN